MAGSDGGAVVAEQDSQTGHAFVADHGDLDAVVGLGGVGLCALLAANAVGAAKIIAIDTNPSKLTVAATLGRLTRFWLVQMQLPRSGI